MHNTNYLEAVLFARNGVHVHQFLVKRVQSLIVLYCWCPQLGSRLSIMLTASDTVFFPPSKLFPLSSISLTRCPIDPLSYWPNVLLTSRSSYWTIVFDQSSYWPIVLLTHWPVVLLTHCLVDSLTCCPIDPLSYWPTVLLTSRSSYWPIVFDQLSYWPIILLTHWPVVLLTCCLIDPLSYWPVVRLTEPLSLTCRLIDPLSCWLMDPLSYWSVILGRISFSRLIMPLLDRRNLCIVWINPPPHPPKMLHSFWFVAGTFINHWGNVDTANYLAQWQYFFSLHSFMR